jgi:hypothetical protein
MLPVDAEIQFYRKTGGDCTAMSPKNCGVGSRAAAVDIAMVGFWIGMP